MYTNGPIRRREALATNLCTLLRPCGRHGSAIVYTNAPNRRPTALITNLCTLLRSHGCWPQQQCTQMAQTGAERSSQLICVHYCVPEAAHHPRATTVYTNGSNRLRDALATNLCTLLRPPFTHNVWFSSRASVPRLFTAMRYRAACLAGGLSRWGREITRMKGLCVWGCPGIAQVLFLYRWKFLLWSRALDSPRFCVWGEASWRQGCVNS